jgi:LysR family transcriptional regulator, nitrogen assimilation regulatory protein
MGQSGYNWSNLPRKREGRLELRVLHYFRTVVECGSFSKAAAKLMVAQPSLSRQIQNLEHELGLTLLHRTARGVAPTEAGMVLMERTMQLEQEMDGIRRTLATLVDGVTGTLRVAVQAPVSFLLLPDLVKNYRARYPDVQLQLVEAFSGDVIQQLLAGMIDVAIVDIPRTPSAELRATPLWVETFCLFGWTNAPAVRPDRKTPVTLPEIARLPLIATSKPHAVRFLIESAFERRSLRFRPVLEANGPLMIFELVRAGLGYTLMPESVLRPFSAFGELRSMPIEPAILRTISIIVRASVAEDRAIATFRELTLSLLPQLTNTRRFGPVALYPWAE